MFKFTQSFETPVLVCYSSTKHFHHAYTHQIVSYFIQRLSKKKKYTTTKFLAVDLINKTTSTLQTLGSADNIIAWNQMIVTRNLQAESSFYVRMDFICLCLMLFQQLF